MTTRRTIPTVLACITLLALAQAGPVRAAWPGANGPIVFEAFIPGGEEERGRGQGIWAAPLGASREQFAQLTTLGTDSDPRVSPDGSRVVFLRATAPEVPGSFNRAAIYTMAIDGTGVTQVTDGTQVDLDPTYSATGSRIYFARRVSGEGLNLYSVGVDGRGLREITSGPASERHPVASPRGRIIAFERSAGRRPQQIFTARVDGTRPHNATPGSTADAEDPDFSPDGTRIAFAVESQLMSVRANGSGRRLLRSTQPGDNILAEPAYSPDGRSLLFTVRNGGRSSLRRIDVRDGRLIANPFPPPHIGINHPSWAPVP